MPKTPVVPMSSNILTSMGTAKPRRDRIVSTPEKLCPMCKRVQRLSGEERCAIHVKATTLAAHHKEFDTKQISGSSPPGVFVGIRLSEGLRWTNGPTGFRRYRDTG